MHPDERRFERCLQRLVTAEDPHLTPLRLRLRGETHRSLAQKHEPGHPDLGLGNEYRPGQRQRQVFAQHHQVVGSVLLGGGQAQVAQAVDRVDVRLVANTPDGIVPLPHDLELPCFEPSPRPRFGEHLDGQRVAGVLRQILDRYAEPWTDDGTIHTGVQILASERFRGVPIRGGRRQ